MSFFKRMFGRAHDAEPPPGVKKVFEKIRRFMNDEAAQNELYPPEAARAIAAGAAVDQVSGASGAFGRDAGNPIPVNGSIGEVLYISSLQTTSGVQMVGHRLGASRNIDVFEVVALDGSVWDILYFDLYHPRKSKLSPPGYTLNQPKFIFATDERIPEFPAGMREAVSLFTKGFLGLPLVATELSNEAQLAQIKRPKDHVEALKRVHLDRPWPAG
jgi:hypothetical protein